jgi:hypothetical protein
VKERRTCIWIPDALIRDGGVPGAAEQNEKVEDEPPLEPRFFDDPAVAQKLPQVRPQCSRRGSFGSAQLHEKDAGHGSVRDQGSVNQSIRDQVIRDQIVDAYP